jgi:hypothetical protein
VILGTEGVTPQVAVGTDGKAVAVWSSEQGLYAAELPASSSTWQTVVPVATTSSEQSHVAIDANGDAIVVWVSNIGESGADPGMYTIQAAVKPAGGAWGQPTDHSETVESSGGYPRFNPNLAVDSQGSGTVLWNGFQPSTDLSVRAAFLPSIGASWQAPSQVADTGGSGTDPEVGMDANGNGVATWVLLANHAAVIQTSNYDASSPAIQSASIPSEGVPGQPLSFAVSPLQLTTPLGQTSWDFGDGSWSTGTGVSHAFAAPGEYHVTVTTADMLGNTTSASGTILVRVPQSQVSGNINCRCKRHEAPRLSRVRVLHRRFRVGRRGGTPSAKRKSGFGTSLRFTLSSTATIQMRITRVSAINGQHHDCTSRCGDQNVIGGARYPAEPEGNDAVYFSGSVDGHALSSGRYIAIVTARNTFGQSAPVRVPFEVLR